MQKREVGWCECEKKKKAKQTGGDPEHAPTLTLEVLGAEFHFVNCMAN